MIKPQIVTCEVLENAFDDHSLEEAFEFVSRKKTRGIDGTTVEKFTEKKQENFEIIKKKCRNGTYRFSPYLLKLQLKGRGASPRVISIATLRDRIVLHVVKNLLQKAFPESVNRLLPNNYIKEINDFFGLYGSDETLCYYKTDIRGFYDSIDHELLLSKIRPNVESSHFLRLVYHALKNPTSSFGSKRTELKNSNRIGVPQGLSISNILADIYMRDFDETLSGVAAQYYRFVDDIILFNLGPTKSCLRTKVDSCAKELRLSLHEKKTICKQKDKTFEYLGYRFELPKITIRESSKVSFINSIASMFSSFKHEFHSTSKSRAWLDQEAKKQIFIESLNEKITGALSESSRYGWLFYFLEINDMPILYQIDKIIDSFFVRLAEFDNRPPAGLKRLARAYYEAKYNAHGNYIHNYNRYITLQDKIQYLDRLGLLNPELKYLPEDIVFLFEKIKMQNLKHLEKDIGNIS